MSIAASLEQDAVNFAKRAVACDEQGLTADAIFYYCVSIVTTVTTAVFTFFTTV